MHVRLHCSIGRLVHNMNRYVGRNEWIHSFIHRRIDRIRKKVKYISTGLKSSQKHIRTIRKLTHIHKARKLTHLYKARKLTHTHRQEN